MRIIKAGISSIQDLGRIGFRNLGITPGGAMDNSSARLCNMLAGNEPGDAMIELMGGELEVISEDIKLLAIGGRGYKAFLSGKPLPLWQPFLFDEGEKLRVIPDEGGIAYIAIHGGFRVPRVLESRTTHLAAGFGGLEGRLLKAGDLLPTAVLNTEAAEKIAEYLAKTSGVSHLRLSQNVLPDHSGNSIRFVPGNEFELFTRASKQLLVNEPFTLTGMSNRMGFRFSGTPLELLQPGELLSTAVVPGTMQASPDGQLLILMADAQTTGGYPRIGQVIAADLPLLAQKTSGTGIRFIPESMEEAERLYLVRERNFHKLQNDYSLYFT
jgi:antagonist of KipI